MKQHGVNEREQRFITEFSQLPDVTGVDFEPPGLFELSGVDVSIVVSSERFHLTAGTTNLSEFDISSQRMFVVLEDLILDPEREPPCVYETDHTIDDAASVANAIQSVLSGNADPISINGSEDILGQFIDAGLLSYQTPRPAAELLVHWAGHNNPTTVLNPGYGSGQFLSLLQNQFIDNGRSAADFQLWGVDTNEIAHEITVQRLQTDDRIYVNDFLDFPSNTLPQPQNEQKSDSSNEIFQFDSIISHPPRIRRSQLSADVREKLQERYDCSLLDQAFVLHSLSLLKDGGHAAFVLPQSSLTNTFIQQLMGESRIHCIASLVESEFIVQGVEPALVLLERTTCGSDEADQVRLLHIGGSEITPRHLGLLHGPDDKAVDRAEDIEETELAVVPIQNLNADLLSLALSAPDSAPFLFSDEFQGLGSVAQVSSGLVTGNSSFFYFSSTEKEESGIDEDLFIPVLRKLSPKNGRITEDEITYYLLDLRSLVADATNDLSKSPSIDEFIQWVEERGYSALSRYLNDHAPKNQTVERLLPKDFTDRSWNPDLVAQSIFSQPEWWLVDIESDVVFDNTLVGVTCSDWVSPTALWALLNTPLYKKLQRESMTPFRGSSEYSRFGIRNLKSLPIIRSCLTEAVGEKLASFLPAMKAHEEIAVRNRIIEACDQSERAAVDAAFEAFSQQGLTWFLSGEELQEFRKRVEEDNHPVDFIEEQFGEDALGFIQQLFSRVELFQARREVLLDLIELFDQDKYQTFLVALASQFEGLLVDYIEATGGRVQPETKVVERNGKEIETEILFYYLSESDKGKKKDLKRLFDEFFEGEYQRFLHETVRERRNDLAHGMLDDDPHRTAVVLLVSFFAMANNILHRYNRYLGSSGN